MRFGTLHRLTTSLALGGGLAMGIGFAADPPAVATGKGCCGKCHLDKSPAESPKEEDQKGLPAGKGPQGKDAEFGNDRDVFHYLLENHKDIKRTVKKMDNGVETVTESEKPEVAKKIQEHVPAMYERLKKNQPVRHWDPLFEEIFKHADKVKMTVEKTAKGVKVVETSDDPAVAKLVIAHADVVSKFVEKGFEEAHKEHPVPVAGKKK